MTAQQRFRRTMAVAAVCSLLPLAYSVFDQAAHRHTHPAALRPSRPVHQVPRGAAMVPQMMPAPYQLPAGISREVVLPYAGGLLLAAGPGRLAPGSDPTALTATCSSPTTTKGTPEWARTESDNMDY